jgi:hypothetical protein
MGQHLDFDKEIELSVPDGISPEAILVDVDIEPHTASCLIFGLMADGHTKFIRLRGGHSQVKLPFVHRKVYLKYFHNITEVRIGTIGYIDRLHSPHG